MNKEEQFKAYVLDQATYAEQSREDLIISLQNLSADTVAPYYSEIIELHETYEDILWTMLQDYVSDIGEGTILSTLDAMSWRYSNRPIEDLTHVKQWVVWFAIEHVAHQLACEMEQAE